MEETNRRMEAEYHDPSLRDGTYDVSFELTEDAEDALFAAFTDELLSQMRDGVFPEQKIHLFQKLAGQRTEHPPWIDAQNGAWTYDLELSEWEYHLLSRVVGNSLDNILGPSAAGKYEELIDAWKTITEQMQADNDRMAEQSTLSSAITEQGEQVISEAADQFGPETGEFKCHVRDGQYRMYATDDGEHKWYVCTDCETSFAAIGDDDDCSQCR